MDDANGTVQRGTSCNIHGHGCTVFYTGDTGVTHRYTVEHIVPIAVAERYGYGVSNLDLLPHRDTNADTDTSANINSVSYTHPTQ